MTDKCNHPGPSADCTYCWKPHSKQEPDYDRCGRCGETLIADGTEEADWTTLCPECDEEWRAEMSGDDDIFPEVT